MNTLKNKIIDLSLSAGCVVAAFCIELVLIACVTICAVWETLFVGGEKVAVRRMFK